MKKTLLLLLLAFSFCGNAQKITLKKGRTTDNISVNDSLAESFALYLPTTFDATKKWPIVFVFDMQGRGKQVISMFRQAAEKEGYILAASNNIHDSLSLTKNILISDRLFHRLYTLLPIKKGRSYTAGYDGGARFASLAPAYLKDIKGVISCGSSIANVEVIRNKRAYHFIGIVGDEDFNYIPMLSSQKRLNKLKLPNQLLVFEGGQEWPKWNYLAKALEYFSLAAIEKGYEIKGQDQIDTSYLENMGKASALITTEKPLIAHNLLIEMISIYKVHKSIDSLKMSAKTLRRTKLYKNKLRSQNASFFKENFIKNEYLYYLEEDIVTYNYNNLGWWQHQMDGLAKYDGSSNIFEKRMGRRLKGYLNALIADNIDAIKASYPVDEEAVTLLWMINTITDAANYKPYLKVISNSARVEDYGTALFYLEELLKIGYTNKAELYALEHAALLRIKPEFYRLIKKYLKESPK